MKLEVRRFEAGDVAAIERLNRRLSEQGVDWPVYWEERSAPDTGSVRFRERFFVAEDSDEIRGGIWLREQEFWVHGKAVTAGWVAYPVAESLIDGRYSGIPASLMLRLRREQPRLMALGLGGDGGAFARLLEGLGWSGTRIPFYFHFVRPDRVLRHLPLLRTSRLRAALMDGLALTGLGVAGYRLGTALLSRGDGCEEACSAERVQRFGPWADEVWVQNRSRYEFIADRSLAMLNDLYSEASPDFIRLRVTRDNDTIGWIGVLLNRPRESGDHHTMYFGELRVGHLVDGFAAPEHAKDVLAAGVRFLRRLDPDLVVSNQSHPVWARALRRLGFLHGPSNFWFFRSPEVGRLLEAGVGPRSGVYLNRGDCDGPVRR